MSRALILLTFFVSTTCHAWNVPADITSRPDYEVGSRVARDPAGNIHLVWYGGVDSGSWQVHYQSWNGISWSAATPISGSAAAGCDLATDAQGDVHVVWNAGGNPEEVYYRRRTAGVWGPVTNLSNSAQRSLTPRIAVGPGGQSPVVAWHESGQTGGEWDVVARTFNGTTWGSLENLSQDSTLSRNADVAIDTTGAAHVVWEDLGDRHLYYRKRTVNGSYSARLAIDSTAGRSYGGSIAAGTDGSVHVAWHDDNDDWEIYYRRFNGSQWAVPINVSQNPDPDHADHAVNVALDENNEAHLLWSDYQDIYYAHTVMHLMRPGYRISAGANQGDPVCVVGADSVLHALWPNRAPGSWDIFHARHTLPDVSPPATLPSFRATPANQQVKLDWGRSVSIDYSGVMIRWRTDHAPQSIVDGYLATNAGPDTFQFIHRGLTNGVTYHYSAFAHDAEPNFTFAYSVSATPLSAPKTNLLVNPAMELGFASGVASGWTRYTANDPSNALTFSSDTTNVDSPANSQAINGLGAATLPATGHSAAGLFQVVTNVRPGALYLFVGYQDIYTSDFGADAARYLHNFGIDPRGGTVPGSPNDFGIIGEARWMGPGRTLYHNNAGGAAYFGGFHRARAAYLAESNRLSVWTGVTINNAAARDNVPAKFNADTHYLFEFDFPTNSALVNGDFSGPTIDLQDGSDVLPDGWLPAGGGVGQVNSWAVATNFARIQNAVDVGARIWGRRGVVNAGLMQRLAVPRGQLIMLQTWLRTSGQDATEGSIGIDPFGRGDITSTDIVWQTTTASAWTSLALSVAAQAPEVTVFLRTSSVSGGGNYHWSDFDDVTVIGTGVTYSSLVPPRSAWSYLPITNDIGASWITAAYDDSAWSSGLAPCGYGDQDEATTVPFYSDISGKNISTYFRHTFSVTNTAQYTNLLVRLHRDDGGVVYLNGVEVFRSNMPNGPVTHNTRAILNVGGADESVNFYATNVNPMLLLEGPNLLAVEIHQNNGTSADISFDAELIGLIDNAFTPNRPPAVVITAPSPDAALSSGANLVISAEASDLDGEVSRISFYEGATYLGEASEPPFSITWSNLTSGTYQITARATDDGGAETASAPVVVRVGAVTLVAGGSVWKYKDDGADQGVAWREPGFDDSTWAAGPAELGYGDGGPPDNRPEATVINNGGLMSRYITAYFRQTFTVIEPESVASLRVRLLRDDGAIVYLNGVEIFRSNMPDGPVDYMTLAATSVNSGPDETTYYVTNLHSRPLRDGANTMAVEVHQVGIGSTDLSFDLELVGFPAETLPKLTAGIDAFGPVLRWSGWAGQFRVFCSTHLEPGASWVPLEGSAVLSEGNWSQRLVAQPTSRFYRLQTY